MTDGARCYLAQQQQNVVQSLLARFPDALAAHADGRASGAASYPIVPLHDIVNGQPVLELDNLDLEPDWADGSGASPVRPHRRPRLASSREAARRRLSVASVG